LSDKLAIAKELAFLAVGRAHSYHDMIRGLVLSPEVSAERNVYVRIGLFQVKGQESFVTAKWDIRSLKIV
jgi:hypothetical protein